MDLMTELGIHVNTETKLVVWEDASIPLKEHGQLNDREVIEMIYTMAKLYWPGMHKHIHEHVKTCDVCQQVKDRKRNMESYLSRFPPPLVPWNRVDVDLIGPVNTPNGKFELRALTVIDPATGWFKVKDVVSPSAKGAMEAFDDTWPSSYPCPEFLGFDGTKTSSKK